jgi:hypothetical protein
VRSRAVQIPRSRGPRGSWAIEALPVVAVLLSGLFEQLVNQPGGFQFVQLAHAFAEPIHGELVHRNFVEFVFVGDFEDQVALFRAALPGVAGSP